MKNYFLSCLFLLSACCLAQGNVHDSIANPLKGFMRTNLKEFLDGIFRKQEELRQKPLKITLNGIEIKDPSPYDIDLMDMQMKVLKQMITTDGKKEEGFEVDITVKDFVVM